MAALKETDLYEPVKEWLESQGYEVFPEVQLDSYGRRADIVALRKPCVCIVELKTAITFKLIEQAEMWKGYANYIYVAVPQGRMNYGATILKQKGIGILTVSSGWPGLRVHAKWSWARFQRAQRSKADRWFDVCCEEHKQGVGGSTGASIITPYRLMMNRPRPGNIGNGQG